MSRGIAFGSGSYSYADRISGPLLDRIDLQIEVPPLLDGEIAAAIDSDTTAIVAARVERARARQAARQAHANALLAGKAIDRHCRPDGAGVRLLDAAVQRFGWSARAYHRVLRIARTIADLDGAEGVVAAHVAEAIGYRRGLQRGG